MQSQEDQKVPKKEVKRPTPRHIMVKKSKGKDDQKKKKRILKIAKQPGKYKGTPIKP